VPNTDLALIDAIGRRRSKVTLPGYLDGRAPHNRGMMYPADPPRVEELIAVMRQAGEDRHGLRIRAVIAVLWRGGLRISEALALAETDADPAHGSVLIRHGKGDRRREVGMDDWGGRKRSSLTSGARRSAASSAPTLTPSNWGSNLMPPVRSPTRCGS
jgi:site-specific recombinase XerC